MPYNQLKNINSRLFRRHTEGIHNKNSSIDSKDILLRTELLFK